MDVNKWWAGSIGLVILAAAKPLWKPLLSTVGGWIIAGLRRWLRKWLRDEDIVAEQKRIVETMKFAVEMLQAVQDDQKELQQKLDDMSKESLFIVQQLKVSGEQNREIGETLVNVRERVSKLEGRLRV